jgi:5-methylcytosine-specific restriction endonuclease McrA
MTQSPATVQRQVRSLRRRYGDDCWLCGLPIDFSITDAAHPMRFSRDHVVPRSLGGVSTLGNLRLAHRQCNSTRGAGPGEKPPPRA